MSGIKADPILLERVAGELLRIAEDIDMQKRILGIAGEETTEVWKSTYTHQFLESVNLTKGKIGASSHEVRSAANALRKIVSEIHVVDGEIQRTLETWR